MFRRLSKCFPAFQQSIGQPRFQRLQFRNFAAHHRQFLRDHVPDVHANFLGVPLNGKQLADFVQRKPELLRLLNKLQIRHFRRMIKPIPAARSL